MTDPDSPLRPDAPSAAGEAPGLAPTAPELASWPTLELEPDDRAPGLGSPAPQWTPISALAALVLALLVGAIGGQLVAVMVGALLGVNVTSGTLAPGLLILATALQEAGFVAMAVVVARRGGQRLHPAQFGLRTTRLWHAIGLMIILYVSFLVVTVAWQAAFNDHTSEKLLNDLGTNDNAALLVASAVLTCVIAPFCEEFLFRGYIFTSLRNGLGPWPAAVITGLVFG